MVARSESSFSVTAWQIRKLLIHGCQIRILLLCDWQRRRPLLYDCQNRILLLCDWQSRRPLLSDGQIRILLLCDWQSRRPLLNDCQNRILLLCEEYIYIYIYDGQIRSSFSVKAWQIMKPLINGCQIKILLLCDSLADQETSDPWLPDLLLCDRLADQETFTLWLPDLLLCDLADQEMIAWSESSFDWHIMASPALWVHGHWSGYKWCLVYGRFCVVFLPYYAALYCCFMQLLICNSVLLLLWNDVVN